MITKKNTLYLLLIISLLFFNELSYGQFQLCGTVLTQEQIDKEKKNQSLIPPAQYPGFAPIHCLRKTVSINAYIMRDSLGNDGITQAAILNAISGVNVNFEPMCLSFQVCAFTYVDNYNYDDFLKPLDEAELVALHYVPNTINMYFAQKVQVTQGNYVGGYAYFPGGLDFIIISKGSATSDVISHELGHFFGLYHTFETKFGAEFVNQSNCISAGDLLCDTPADPNGVAGLDCQLSPYTKDLNGDWYVPETGNIMSYYSGCTCGFTTQQFNRMAEQYLTIRNYLW
ncbi:MAG: M43 family zinc metalloprotease [Bacteroidia bacterium]